MFSARRRRCRICPVNAASGSTGCRRTAEQKERGPVSERWIPILAAVVGVIGGTAGAYIGGYVANQGQEARFDHEDEIRQDDLRRTAFSDFLQAASNVNQGAGDSNEQLASVDTAEAKVGLFATTATQDAASDLTDAVYARGD